jgi:hypothetical protein
MAFHPYAGTVWITKVHQHVQRSTCGAFGTYSEINTRQVRCSADDIGWRVEPFDIHVFRAGRVCTCVAAAVAVVHGGSGRRSDERVVVFPESGVLLGRVGSGELSSEQTQEDTRVSVP